MIDYSAAQKKKQNGKVIFTANRLITKKTKDGLELEELNIINWQISKIWYTKLSKIFYNFSSLNDRLRRAATKAFFTIERNVKANLRNIAEIDKISENFTSNLTKTIQAAPAKTIPKMGKTLTLQLNQKNDTGDNLLLKSRPESKGLTLLSNSKLDLPV